MTKKEVKEIFNNAFIEYLEKLEKETLKEIATISEFEIIFFKKLDERGKKS
jgi:hypothetical protein